MDWVLASLPGMIPEGPLHPGLALGGVVVGVSTAFVAGRNLRSWTLLATFATLTLIAVVNRDWMVPDLVDRRDRVLVVGATVAVVIAAMALRPHRATATVAAVAACGGIWAIVPDTEAPLLAGAVLLGATLVTLIPGWITDARHRVHGLLLLLPMAAAATGSAGRPARFQPAVLVGASTLVVGLVAAWIVVVGRRRQRAGMPTTVAPGATSTVTTAPAPTTAP